MAPVLVNADKPHLWNSDIELSVDQFNVWFMRFAPEAFRSSRIKATEDVKQALLATGDLRQIDGATLKAHPSALPTLRMCTAPPLAVDRLIGLAGVDKNLVGRLERAMLPKKMDPAELDAQLTSICEIVSEMLDIDIFPWLVASAAPSAEVRDRASTIVADRLCGTFANPIVRNAQEQRQLVIIERWLTARGYRKAEHSGRHAPDAMEPGTFALRMNIAIGQSLKVNIPIDVAVHPMKAPPNRMPILIEAKSAGDFTNTNKRRKEEATKVHQLRAAYGASTLFILFLCGYFGSDYLGYEAAEGLDWVWEHRIDDLALFGL